MSAIVDSSAILAFLFNEPGADRAEAALADAHASTVIVSETVAKLVDRGHRIEDAWDLILQLALTVHSFDTPAARLAAGLRLASRRVGLSFADRACLALGLRLGLPVYTADSAWAQLDIGVNVVLVR